MRIEGKERGTEKLFFCNKVQSNRDRFLPVPSDLLQIDTFFTYECDTKSSMHAGCFTQFLFKRLERLQL